MQNKNLRKILLASLGALGPLVSGTVSAAEAGVVNKNSDKAISDTAARGAEKTTSVNNKAINSKTTEKVVSQEGGRKEKKKSDKDKSDSLKAATDLKKGSKLTSSDILKLLGAFTVGGAIVQGVNVIYNKFIKNKTHELYADWDKNKLIDAVVMGKDFYELAKIPRPTLVSIAVDQIGENDLIVVTDDEHDDAPKPVYKVQGTKLDINKYNYIEQIDLRLAHKMYESNEVLNVYNQLFKLYDQLLHSENVRTLKYKDEYDGYTKEENKKYWVLNSVIGLVGRPLLSKYQGCMGGVAGNQTSQTFWDIPRRFYEGETPYISCDMPDGTFTYESTIAYGYEDENCTKHKNITYRATFKKENGKLTFEKLEFVNPN